ncbi:MAG TPA: hypothetical protein VFL82_04610 [Thermomicrobiales bacterium]|nr:hypothetical protein [Thermomicrobiales bacterium]
MNDLDHASEDLNELPVEPIRPEDNASAARSCLVILLLIVLLLVILGVYLIATAVT